jgi:hypothetical protein
MSGAALLIAAFFSWRRYGRSWRRSASQNSAASAVAFYQEMLQCLERAGHKRPGYLTPAEYAEQLRMPVVSEITRVYQQARFGDWALDPSEIGRVDLLLRELKKQSGASRRSRRNSSTVGN